jgi:hypothetical protein
MHSAMRRQSELGLSLLPVVMLMAVMGIVSSTVSGLMSNSFRAQKSLNQSADYRDLRTFLNGKVSCSATKSIHPTCSAATIALYDASGAVVVPTSGRTFGQYSVRATCLSNRLVVKVAGSSSAYEPLFVKAPFQCQY